MSKGLAFWERTVVKYEEEMLRPKLPLDPRAVLHNKDVQTLLVSPKVDCSPEHIKEEEEEIPLELPFTTVIVKNENDIDKSSPIKQEPGEDYREDAAGEPGCSLDLPSDNKGHIYSSFDTDDSEDWEPSAKRSIKRDGQGSNADRSQKGVQSHLVSRELGPFLFHTRPVGEDGEDPLGEQYRGEKPGCSSDLMNLQSDSGAHSSFDTEDSEELDSPAKRKKRSNTTINEDLSEGEGKTKHKCSECGKYFQCEAHLQRHMLIHYGLKPFECPVCDKAFRYKSSYKAHLNMHTEEKPLSCSLCDKGFTQSRDLKRHMLSHTDEKNFDCPECGGKFKHKHNLIRHISAIHKAEKPYPCPMCEKAFAQKHDFMTHMRTHSGEKPFSCHICSRSFGAKGTLRTHMKVHRKRVPKDMQGSISFDNA